MKTAETPTFPGSTKPAAQEHDDDRPRFWGALGNIIHALHAIAKAVQRREQQFREVVATNAQRIGPQLTAGVLRSVHNPTAAALLVSISDGSNAQVLVFSATLPAGAVVPCYQPFKDGLYGVAGAGAILGGTFDA